MDETKRVPEYGTDWSYNDTVTYKYDDGTVGVARWMDGLAADTPGYENGMVHIDGTNDLISQPKQTSVAQMATYVGEHQRNADLYGEVAHNYAQKASFFFGGRMTTKVNEMFKFQDAADNMRDKMEEKIDRWVYEALEWADAKPQAKQSGRKVCTTCTGYIKHMNNEKALSDIRAAEAMAAARVRRGMSEVAVPEPS
ncbi:MAG: hypothetical protein FWE38_03550 [Firmicutes bacterium]|nr:hypothetical protein [Bacillota bacterium]